MPFNILAVYQRVLWQDWHFETITNTFKNSHVIAINLKLRKNKHRKSTKLLKFSLSNQNICKLDVAMTSPTITELSKQWDKLAWIKFVGIHF